MSQSDLLDCIESESVRIDAGPAFPGPDGDEPDDDDQDEPPDREPEPVSKRDTEHYIYLDMAGIVPCWPVGVVFSWPSGNAPRKKARISLTGYARYPARTAGGSQ